MISFRRLRAVLVFGLVSAVAWALLGTMARLLVTLFRGRSLSLEGLASSLPAFGFIGFIAGVTYAISISVSESRRETGRLTALRSGAVGAVGGAVVFIALNLWFVLTEGSTASILFPTMIFAALGGVTGVLIQRSANRGVLPPEPPEKQSLGTGE
ncbi:MAG: hypothetical protein ABI039_11635 [Vicinamibacterales bacterium]